MRLRTLFVLASLAIALGLIAATQAFAAKDSPGGGSTTDTPTTETTGATTEGTESTSAAPAASTKSTSFDMFPASNAISTCLPHATAHVSIKSKGAVEVMNVSASGLPKNKDFDLFVIEEPDAPSFGVSWYQGDLETDKTGHGTQTYRGRFSIETFALGAGNPAPPIVHTGQDATFSPAFNPIHTFHLGLWFNSPADATAAGCPGGTTPFNGDHTAGVQVLKTKNDVGGANNGRGPLGRIQ